MSRPTEAAPALIYKEGEDIILDGEEFASQLPGSPVTKILTNAEFKALPTTPYVIVPATSGALGYDGDPNELFFPTFAYGILDTRAGAYTNVDDEAYLILALSSDWSMDVSYKTKLKPGDHVTNARISRLPFALPGIVLASASGDAGFVDEYAIPAAITDNLEDNALVIAGSNASAGDFTGGHADNTFTLVVHYERVTMPV